MQLNQTKPKLNIAKSYHSIEVESKDIKCQFSRFTLFIFDTS